VERRAPSPQSRLVLTELDSWFYYWLLVWFSVRIYNNWRPPWGKGLIGLSTMSSKWVIEGLSGNNWELWKVEMGARAILRFGMMDKTWRVVIRYLGGEKLMEIAMKVSLERRW
ncbi:hypothetical protein L195_g057232, partial [Trifolium pratense]